MTCHNCARQTLSLFIRSFVDVGFLGTRHPAFLKASTRAAFIPTTFRSHHKLGENRPSIHTTRSLEQSQNNDVVDIEDDNDVPAPEERPAWQVQKAALKEKLGGQAWNPRKKLSPDTMEGIRHLHSTQPAKFTTPVLAEHFKVSPEAIRRILKSKWRPSDEEHESRMQRWDKRGERIWSTLVEMGVKPPKVWREMGVGRSVNGETPKWKGRRRNLVHVRDSASDNFVVEEGDIIPIAGTPRRPAPGPDSPISRRL